MPTGVLEASTGIAELRTAGQIPRIGVIESSCPIPESEPAPAQSLS